MPWNLFLQLSRCFFPPARGLEWPKVNGKAMPCSFKYLMKTMCVKGNIFSDCYNNNNKISSVTEVWKTVTIKLIPHTSFFSLLIFNHSYEVLADIMHWLNSRLTLSDYKTMYFLSWKTTVIAPWRWFYTTSRKDFRSYSSIQNLDGIFWSTSWRRNTKSSIELLNSDLHRELEPFNWACSHTQGPA